MPIYEYVCLDCSKTSEVLLIGSGDQARCSACGSKNLKKLLSMHAGVSGNTRSGVAGPGDTACCGSTPGHAGCAGPGSCCGKG